MLSSKDYSVVRNSDGKLAILVDASTLSINKDDDAEIIGSVMKIGKSPVISDLPDSVLMDKRVGKKVEIYTMGKSGEINAWQV